jgi:glycine cleavage system H lipoate-binding protein
MFGHDPYAAKAVEYLLGVAFLLLFAGFWQYAMGGTRLAPLHLMERARRRLPQIADMFRVPADVMLHPGHAWARVEEPGLVAIGVDDFAQQLVGPIDRVSLPTPGTRVKQGAPALGLRADSRLIPVLSPISGRVVAVNAGALNAPHAINADPYGEGWLLKVRPHQLPVDTKQLVSGDRARQWVASSWDELSTMLSPELGTIMHDGGMPVAGLARGIDREHWDEIARRFLLSQAGEQS